jgi:hypothetical protein
MHSLAATTRMAGTSYGHEQGKSLGGGGGWKPVRRTDGRPAGWRCSCSDLPQQQLQVVASGYAGKLFGQCHCPRKSTMVTHQLL